MCVLLNNATFFFVMNSNEYTNLCGIPINIKISPTHTPKKGKSFPRTWENIIYEICHCLIDQENGACLAEVYSIKLFSICYMQIRKVCKIKH